MRRKPRSAMALAGLLGAVVISAPAIGQDVNAIIAAEEQRTRAAQRAQDEIDQIAERTRERFEEYQLVVRDVEGLTAHNDLMQASVDLQNQELEDLYISIDRVTLIERQILPLMTRMIDSLEQFIDLDVPFLLEERRARVAELRGLLTQSDITSAVQFRNVMQAWQIENDYGRFAETYIGEVEIGGVLREVSYLKVGRIGLYYVTPDSALAGAWDQQTREWVELAGKDAAEIRTGVNVIETSSPQLFMIPIAAPQEN